MRTITYTELRLKGLRILTDKMGKVEAERFIALIIREPFDYTEWQKNLFIDETIDSLSKKAMKNR